MSKVNVYVVAGPNQGKTTIAHIIKEALVQNGIKQVALLDTKSPQAEDKLPIEQRMAATKERPVDIEVISSDQRRTTIPTILARIWLQALKNAKEQIKTLGPDVAMMGVVQLAQLAEIDRAIEDLQMFVL